MKKIKKLSSTPDWEVAFKAAVHNFDPSKIWFEHPRGFSKPSKICFVWNGVLAKFTIHKDFDSINVWKNHFISFIETGSFDYHAYWTLYPDTNIAANDCGKKYMFPMKSEVHDHFNPHSPELDKFMLNYRLEYPKANIKLITKPIL